MTQLDAQPPTRGARRPTRIGVLLAAAVLAVAVAGVTLFAVGGDARSKRSHAAAAPKFVPVCTQRQGNHESVGDLNARLNVACAKGQKPLKLALYPVTGAAGPQGPPGPAGGAAPEYGVGNVLVARGGGHATLWATYSTALGSPVGTTTGGTFRFSCSPSQGPCKLSIAAAVLSGATGTMPVHAKVLIIREAAHAEPLTFCEYADGVDSNGAAASVSRVPMSTPAASIATPLSMGVGGTLDCAAGQPPGSSVKEIWVPGGSNGKTSYYNVSTTFLFGG